MMTSETAAHAEWRPWNVFSKEKTNVPCTISGPLSLNSPYSEVLNGVKS